MYHQRLLLRQRHATFMLVFTLVWIFIIVQVWETIVSSSRDTPNTDFLLDNADEILQEDGELLGSSKFPNSDNVLLEESTHTLPRHHKASSSSSSLSSSGDIEEPVEDDESVEDKRFYADRHLPRPQLRLPTDRGLRFQMHNCLRGRDGSKFGLRDAGVPFGIQKSFSPMPLLRNMDDSSVILACNNAKPAKWLSRDPKINGKKLIATTLGIIDYYCLGSIKIEQLKCRRVLAQRMGCDYDSLGIQPAQFILANEDECVKLIASATTAPEQPWLLKPSESQRGRGIRFFKDSKALLTELQSLGGCSAFADKKRPSALRGFLVQAYVAKPALLDVRYKFDVRSWLLVASVDPLILFYHEGFVRVAKTPYDEDSTNLFAHITNLKGSEDSSATPANADSQQQKQEQQQQTRRGDYLRTYKDASKELSRAFNLPDDFMATTFREQIERAQVFAALAQFSLNPPADLSDNMRKGFYHLFACDSVVDREGGVHLLECNGFPAESQQVVVTGLQIWREMISLVLTLHLEPWRLLADSRAPPKPPPGLAPVKDNDTTWPPNYVRRGLWKTLPPIQNADTLSAGYSFGGWHLSYNELETPMDEYNVCASSSSKSASSTTS